MKDPIPAGVAVIELQRDISRYVVAASQGRKESYSFHASDAYNISARQFTPRSNSYSSSDDTACNLQLKPRSELPVQEAP